ncbi:mediator complex protein-domain-containing protein [Coniochaeta sp. 2T2.1]|nr:mediator complex protein-domain-containing protein [Coniochaeta sp. 2T2.1]
MAEPSQEQVDIHAPFTKQELIQQLAQIDEDITLLLSHSGTAIQSLTTPAPSSSSSTSPPPPPGVSTEPTLSTLDPEERLDTFKSSMNAFISTLHSVDVRLKRQIWGLEEAGVITLKGGGEGDGKGAKDEGMKTNLEPDGVGKMGGLDVGWLNARSSKVERDMEAELWTATRKLLKGEGGQGGDGKEVQGDGEDVSMLG